MKTSYAIISTAIAATTVLISSVSAQESRPAQPATQPATTSPTSELPSAKDILSRSIEAMGGKDKLSKIHSMSVRLDSDSETMPGNPQRTDALTATDRRFAYQSYVGDQLKVTNIQNGDVVWNIDAATGKATLGKLDSINPIRLMWDLHWQLRSLEKVYTKIEMVGKDVFEDKECFRLQMTGETGKTGFYYFDTKTGLFAGYDVPAPNGSVFRIRVNDWKEVESVKCFHTQHVVLNKLVMLTTKYSQFEFNTVDEDMFIVPDEILIAHSRQKARAAHRNTPPPPSTIPTTKPSTQPSEE